jgi:hypothetical protein
VLDTLAALPVCRVEDETDVMDRAARLVQR